MSNNFNQAPVQFSGSLVLPTTNPVHSYLGRLGVSSRRTMLKLLNLVAGFFSQGLSDAYSFDWSSLRYEHTSELRLYIAEQYAAATANLILAALRGVLADTWRLGQISHDEFERAVDLANFRGERKRPTNRLELSDIEQLLQTCVEDTTIRGLRDKAIVAVLYGAGLRRAELVALGTDNYQIEYLNVPGKGKTWRTIYIAEEVQEALDGWMAARGSWSGPLFTAIHRSGRLSGRNLNVDSVARILAKRAADANLPHIAPHDLRRSMATNLLDSGVDLFLVQRILGHKRVSTTRLYDLRESSATKSATQNIFKRR